MSDATRLFSQTVRKPVEGPEATHGSVPPAGSPEVRDSDERLPVGVCLLIWISISAVLWTVAIFAARWMFF